MDHDLYGKSKAFLWHQCKEGPYDFSFDIEDIKEFFGAADKGRSEEALLYLQGEGLIRNGAGSRYLLTQTGRSWALEQELSSPYNWAKKIEEIKNQRNIKSTKIGHQPDREPPPLGQTAISNTPSRRTKPHTKSESPTEPSKRATTRSMEKQPRRNQVKVLLDDSELKYLESLVGTVGDDKASILRNLLFAHFHRAEYLQDDAPKTGQQYREVGEDEMERLANLIPAMLFFGHQHDQELGDITANEGFSISKNSSDEEIKSILSLAAKSTSGSIVNLATEGGDVEKKVSGYLDGIRLLYDGSIELYEQTVPVRFLCFRPHSQEVIF